MDPSRKGLPTPITAGTPANCTSALFACGYLDPMPSPNGRELLYRGTDGSLWLARGDGRSPQRLTADGSSADWSRDSRYVAFSADDGIHIANAGGGGDRVVARELEGDVTWSADGKRLFVVTTSGDVDEIENGQAKLLLKTGIFVETSLYGRHVLPAPDKRSLAIIGARAEVVSLPPARVRAVPLLDTVGAAAWARDSRRLAAITPRGLRIYDVRSGKSRLVTRRTGFPTVPEVDSSGLGLAWAPGGRTLAYIQGFVKPFDGGIENADLRVTSPRGRGRTLVSSNRAFGGRMVSIAWAPSPVGLHYGRPATAPARRATPTSLLAPGTVSGLAADGERVAFIACQGVYVWTPASGDVVTAEQMGLPSSCTDHTNYSFYDVALADDKLLYSDSFGCNSITQRVRFRALAPSVGPTTIAAGAGNCGGPYHPFVGDLQGSGDLLVFGNWSERVDYSTSPTLFTTTHEDIERVDAQGCPCPVIGSSPGPLVPADVDAGRIVAFGDNATLLLDRDGRVLLSIPVSPTAAQLAGNDLVVLVPGALRDYDATRGTLLHAWQLPGLTNGRACWLRCATARLVLEDASRGLVAYTLDGNVHVLRLADGADRVVAHGSTARFLTAGLVYADGSRLHLVSYAKLPLRAL
jgi:dipeptidyl aminopeptidase/acylaminoacyl peptidase